MVSTYILTIDIYAKGLDVSKEEFETDINQSKPVLVALSSAFGRESTDLTFYPPYAADESTPNYEWWSARFVVLVSVGKKRAESLIILYQAISRLLMHELPDYEVGYTVDEWKF